MDHLSLCEFVVEQIFDLRNRHGGADRGAQQWDMVPIRSVEQFLYREVYSSGALGRARAESIESLTKMFRYLMEHPEAAPGLDPDKKPRHRAVCDYIAGMTDRYFFRVYEGLFPDSPATI